jgi:signal transduction histidine kinase
MKTFCLILQFIFLSYSCWSQDTREIIYIESLPEEGFLLDKGWKFQAGDNPDYANADYDDSNWQRINPTLDMRDLPESTKSGICWLRLHLVVDSSLLREQLSLLINQSVASEIYLNGRLLYKFGTISDNLEEIIAYNPLAMPFSLPFDKSKEQLLAVRYVFQPNISYLAAFGQSPFLRIHLNKTYAAVKQWRRLDRGLPTSIIIRIGAFIILAIFYLSFFVYYPEQKANLFFFLHALLLMMGDGIQFNFVSGHIEIQYLFLLVNLAVAFWDLAHLFLLTALYSLLWQKRSWIYLGLTAAIFVGIFLNFSGFPNSFEISQFVISNLVNIEIVRTAVKALKLNMKGAWIIAAGAISFSIFWAAFVLGTSIYNYIYIPISENYQLGDVLYNLAYLSIPMATAIYMALDFAFTSHALKEKLTEVEDLSRKTIAQEKEKQQILSSQKETLEKQVTERTAELKQSLEELKSTQAQLIQQEKMASLGELTAGIAHEIQNPLNFVNNFSEVSQELVDELQQELDTGDTTEAKALAEDIKQNLCKIHHHGKRADSIVKNMLQHSRSSQGERQLTDINALADEYLRLAYHGLRAKDKEFNADFKLEADPNLSKIEVVPQEIGRVLLNLFNNAFYATEQKKAQLNGQYQPQVKVTTKTFAGKVEIKVRDNGVGIPESVQQKIFQPFFTTKPTGEGTGLGLSLSYDIITKGHEGELKVESKDGEFTEFIILLPKKKSNQLLQV